MAIITYPTYLQPSVSGDIVGFNIQNATASTQAARYVSWGQAFKQGDVANTASLVATINGVGSIPVQVDIKTKYSDNSIRFAIITVQSPTLTANQVVQGMLSIGGSVGSPVDLVAALSSYSCSVTFTGGISTTKDVKALLVTSLGNSSASYWLQGQNATQARVYIPISNAFQLVVDITGYVDGTFLTDFQFRNDYSMTASGGTASYTAALSINGSTVFTSAALTHYQYEVWRRVFYGGGVPTSDTHNIQRDVAYYIRAGALSNYDLTTGIESGSIASFSSTNVSPLSNPGYDVYMPDVGHRDDVGPMPGWHGRWVKSQAPSAAKHALAMANGGGSIPWHHFNPTTKDHITLTSYPTLWIDAGNRGDVDLTQAVLDPTWTLDNAHHPAVAFIPYLFTGDRYFLDEVNAVASYQVLSVWPTPRKDGLGIIWSSVYDDAYEVRASGWILRSINEAAWANPDGSTAKTYWQTIANNNYDEFINILIPRWNTRSGETAGYFVGNYRGDTAALTIAPWQQDYVMSTLVVASLRGDTKATQIINWAKNWQVGRFTHQGGLGWAAATSYQFVVSTTSGTMFTTWAQLGTANGSSDTLVNDGSDFVTLPLMTLAGIYNITGDASPLAQYIAVKAVNTLGTRDSDYQTIYPQFHVVPQQAENPTMVAGPFTFYDTVAKSIADGTLDLDSHTFKLQLHTSSYVPSASHVNITDLTNEVANANGYTTGGATLGSVTWNRSNGVTTFDSADVVWTASGGSIVARFAVLIDTTASPNKLIGYMLLDTAPANVTATTGNTFTVAPHATQGWFQLTVNA